MNKFAYIIIAVLIATLVSLVADATTMTVYSKTDGRLKWYNDSMDCYKFGIWQIQLAKGMKNRKDTAEGHRVYEKIGKRGRQMNPHIKPIGCVAELSFFYEEVDDFWGTMEYWSPDIYMRPRVVVVFKDTVIKKSITIMASVKTIPAQENKIIHKRKKYVQSVCVKPADTAKAVINPVATYTLLTAPAMSKRHRDCGIWMPSGNKMSKEDFVARYGIELYDKIVGTL